MTRRYRTDNDVRSSGKLKLLRRSRSVKIISQVLVMSGNLGRHFLDSPSLPRADVACLEQEVARNIRCVECEVHTKQYRKPADIPEHPDLRQALRGNARKVPPEYLQPRCEVFRNPRFAFNSTPEGRVLALREAVMRDNELKDIGAELLQMSVVPHHNEIVEVSGVENRSEHLDPHLRDGQTGRFEWLDETTGKTDCDAVAYPHVSILPRFKLNV